MSFLIFLLAVLGFASESAASSRSEEPVFAAMSAELERSMNRLRRAEKVPLYFLEYEVTDVQQYRLAAAHGGLTWEDPGSHERYLDVDVRVGSRRLDNTHQIKGPGGADGYCLDA